MLAAATPPWACARALATSGGLQGKLVCICGPALLVVWWLRRPKQHRKHNALPQAHPKRPSSNQRAPTLLMPSACPVPVPVQAHRCAGPGALHAVLVRCWAAVLLCLQLLSCVLPLCQLATALLCAATMPACMFGAAHNDVQPAIHVGADLPLVLQALVPAVHACRRILQSAPSCFVQCNLQVLVPAVLLRVAGGAAHGADWRGRLAARPQGLPGGFALPWCCWKVETGGHPVWLPVPAALSSRHHASPLELPSLPACLPTIRCMPAHCVLRSCLQLAR